MLIDIFVGCSKQQRERESNKFSSERRRINNEPRLLLEPKIG